MNIPCSCTCTLLKSQSHELECCWFTHILISVCSFVWRNNEPQRQYLQSAMLLLTQVYPLCALVPCNWLLNGAFRADMITYVCAC